MEREQKQPQTLCVHVGKRRTHTHMHTHSHTTHSQTEEHKSIHKLAASFTLQKELCPKWLQESQSHHIQHWRGRGESLTMLYSSGQGLAELLHLETGVGGAS